MYSRLVALTYLVSSISPWNVWDLPWFQWVAYAAFVDEYNRQRGQS